MTYTAPTMTRLDADALRAIGWEPSEPDSTGNCLECPVCGAELEYDSCEGVSMDDDRAGVCDTFFCDNGHEVEKIYSFHSIRVRN